MNQDIYVVIEHLQGQVADISYVMLAAARVLVQETGGNVVAVLLGHEAQGLAGNLADAVRAGASIPGIIPPAVVDRRLAVLAEGVDVADNAGRGRLDVALALHGDRSG